MDRTGLLDKIMASVYNIYRGRQGFDTDGGERDGRINFQRGLAQGMQVFQEIRAQAAEDLGLVMLAEYTFLGQEREFCDPSDTNAITSLDSAVQDFDEAFLSLEVLENPDGYKCVEKAFSHRPAFRYKGMPKDAFHVAYSGHIVRISNILKSPGINLTEKEFLEHRRSSMRTARSVYLEKQKQILGIE